MYKMFGSFHLSMTRMRVFIILLVMILVIYIFKLLTNLLILYLHRQSGNGQSVFDYQATLIDQINNIHYPSFKQMLSDNIAQFNYEAKNAMAYQIATAYNTIIYFGPFSPLSEWIDFLLANINGVASTADAFYLYDFEDQFFANMDLAFAEFNNDLETIYYTIQSVDSMDNKPCQARIMYQLYL